MFKAAIIGCGKIADAHAAQIQRIKDCEIVADCDREELMAKQLFERFPVKHYFDNLEQLLEKSKPDVVHVTTPPASHYQIARQCLLQGVHVYVEKPFTLNAGEAAELIGLAERKGLRITAGHDDQFRPAAVRLRRMVRDGFLGGPPVHMESYYGYEFSETSSYARALLGDKRH